LRGVRREQVRRGQVVAAMDSAVTRDRFTAEAYLLTAAEGGRHTPIASGYRPQVYLRTADVVGEIELAPPGIGRPGQTVSVTVTLGHPVVLEPGLGFAIREGGRTVGAGTVSALVP